MRERARKAAVGCAMLVLLVAGVAKLLALPEFVDSLTTWTVLPQGARAAIALLVPTAEVAIAAMWFAGIGMRVATVCGLSLVASFTLAYAWNWIVHEPPDCACFGRLVRFEQQQDAGWGLLGRNVAIMILLIPGLVSPAPAKRTT